jgi:hypothetical protein
VHLTVALADHVLSLRLAGLFAPISAARAVKGKSRVTLKLTKAAPAVWTSVVNPCDAAAAAGTAAAPHSRRLCATPSSLAPPRPGVGAEKPS